MKDEGKALSRKERQTVRKLKFNHNDYVSVTLTKEGAEHISATRKEFYDSYPKSKRGKEFYVEGEVLRTQFWCLIGDFHEMITIGSMSPFYMGEIEVESSMEG